MNRYNSYKDSGVEWVDLIPIHWKKSKLKYVSEIITGNTPSKNNDDNYLNGKYLWIKPDGLNGFIPTNDCKERISDIGLSETRIVPPLSVLLNGIGNIGKFGYSEFASSTNQQIHSVVFNNDVNNKFGLYLISNLTDEMNKNSEKVVISIYTKTKLSNLDIILPPLQEQEQIVAYLDKKTAIVDTLISSKEKKINILKEKRTALINHVITKGLDPNVKLKDSGVEWIGEIPEHWEMKKMKYLFQIRKRISGELGYDVLSITQKGVKIKDIESGKGQVSMDYTKYQIVEIGDFAMNHMDLLTGFIDISPYKGVTSPDYRVFTKTDEKINSKFYLSLFQFGYTNKVFYGFGQGSSMFGRWRLPSSEFNNFKLPYPSLEEQNQIVKYLDNKFQEIDETILLEEKKIETLKEYRQALISEVVTGKIKVIND